MIYNISEIFHSIQGEGAWTGTPMMFVRLAGCNVGKANLCDAGGQATPQEQVIQLGQEMFQHPSHTICTSFDGQRFLCDTDYHKKEELSAEDIASALGEECHVCITGGEPLLHNLEPLFEALVPKGLQLVHIETSGTRPFKLPHRAIPLWLTVCPKRTSGDPRQMPDLDSEILRTADEWKVLVGPQFNEDALYWLDEKISEVVEHRYLQPINGVNSIWKENVQKCLELLQRWPHWKLSAQLHKYLEVR